MEPLEFVSAILLHAKDPAQLSTWYRDTLGIPLKLREHGGEPHFECMIGMIHFAIHEDTAAIPGGAIDIAFHVLDIAATAAALEARGIVWEEPPMDAGFSILASLRDPAGNKIWISQVTQWMVEEFEEQRARSHDIATLARAYGIVPD